MQRQHLTIFILMLLAGLAGCAPRSSFTPTPTKTPAAEPALQLSRTPTFTSTAPTITPVPLTSTPTPNEPSPTPSQLLTTTVEMASSTSDAGEVTATAPLPTQRADLPADHYWMRRPIGEGGRDYIDRTYAYGSTSGGRLRPHTGVEFFNPQGIPVVAAGNATVVHAGTDLDEIYGPSSGFYGNLIVLQMADYTYSGQPVYTLYGHLSEIDVEPGQQVASGDRIGAVGGTGVANGGTHLHFEIRLENPMDYYSSTRNPDLWLQPYYGFGTLAGRVINADGALLRNVSLTIRGEDAVRYTGTYAGDENIPDSAWGENFTYGDLPEGWYTVTTRSSAKIYRAQVYIRAGQTTWLEFRFDD